MRRVAVTGLGLVSPLGDDAASVLAAARAGIDAPQARGTIKNLAAVAAGVIHALGAGEQARRGLELAVGGKRHPVAVEHGCIGLVVSVHGRSPLAGAIDAMICHAEQVLFWLTSST